MMYFSKYRKHNPSKALLPNKKRTSFRLSVKEKKSISKILGDKGTPLLLKYKTLLLELYGY